MHFFFLSVFHNMILLFSWLDQQYNDNIMLDNYVYSMFSWMLLVQARIP